MRLLNHDYAGHPFQVQLSRELARRNHVVTHAFAGGLLTPRGSLAKRRNDPDTFESIEVAMDPNYRRDKYKFIRRRKMEVEYGNEISNLIRRKKPDCVISANTPTEPQLKIAETCGELGIRFVPWIQDFYSIAVAKLAKKKLPIIGNVIAYWYERLEIKTLQSAAAVVSITDDFVPMLRRFGVPRDRIVTIPNWAPLDELAPQRRENTWSAQQGLDGKFVFLYSGTLAMKHNPDLLRRLAINFRGDENVRVVVISEGPGSEWLKEQKQRENLHNLVLLPFQPFEVMPFVMGSADVLITVLEADAGIFSVPSKVLSYHCANRPLLAAMPTQNLAARIIVENQTGLCVAPNDADGFLKAGESLYRNSALRQECGDRARKYAEDNFEIGKIANKFESCLHPPNAVFTLAATN